MQAAPGLEHLPIRKDDRGHVHLVCQQVRAGDVGRIRSGQVDEVRRVVRIDVGLDVPPAEGGNTLGLRRWQQDRHRLVPLLLQAKSRYIGHLTGVHVVEVGSGPIADVVTEHVRAGVEEPPVLQENHRRVETPETIGLGRPWIVPLPAGTVETLDLDGAVAILVQATKRNHVAVTELGGRRVPVPGVEIIHPHVLIRCRIEDIR